MVIEASGWSRWLKWLISIVMMMYPFFSQNEGPSVDKPYPRSINVFISGKMPLLQTHKLLATIYTVFRSLASCFRVSLFTTLLGGNTLINDFATVRAKSHRGVFAPVIQVRTPISLLYHLILLCRQDYEQLFNSPVAFSRSSS